MKITWYGTASIVLESGGERILFDPFVQLRGGEHIFPPDTFAQEKHIFITHGHVDHLLSVPDIQKISGADIYCTDRPADTLEHYGGRYGQMIRITPGDRISIGGIQVTVLPGKHISFDWRLIVVVLSRPQTYLQLRNSLFLAKMHHRFPENGEIVIYQIEAEGKMLLLMGSLGLSDGVDYPRGADLLILPFQGRSRLSEAALPVIEKLNPKSVLLDHFDDAFPPISSSISTVEFVKRMAEIHPDHKIIIPLAGIPINITASPSSLKNRIPPKNV
ncbi:MBL fold metallo-hydrolase [Diplocloster modestus]|uniref:MBL fold metallo-hydrolase n=1 Tax=Diplocloster modestus TaxID=2850322 RepID=A0ABS6KDG5_9FIRM|nr:MBL fold metallo-hydrolase [Diplocloster modestus]MBU9728553.1 MBL fold metallo-hydrolase [Diplocloster modestus]